MRILGNPYRKIVGNACCFLLNSLLDVTDKFEHAQKAACSDGLVHFLVTEVFPLLHDVELGKVGFKLLYIKSMAFIYIISSLYSHAFWRFYLSFVHQAQNNYFT